MDRDVLLARLDEKACLGFLAEMVRHKSYSETEGERALAEFMAAHMRGLGLDAELQPVEGTRVNAIGRWRGAGGGKSLLFNGHLDTNPVTEGWTVDPWGGVVDDRFVYGIGVSNSGARSDEHRSINRAHVGVVHGALGRGLQEWRPSQVADFVRIKGSARYAPGQTEEQVLADIRRVLADFEKRFPGLHATVTPEHLAGRPVMPPFEVAKDSRIVKSVDAACETVRGGKQPTGAIRPPGFYGTDAGHLHRELGMEGVACGPGGRYNTMPDERVDIPDYLDMVRIYMLSILDTCGVA